MQTKKILMTITIDFILRLRRMSGLFLELTRTVLFLSYSPLTIRLRIRKLLVSVDAVVALAFFATTLKNKHMATVLLSYVLVRHWQQLESLVTPSPSSQHGFSHIPSGHLQFQVSAVCTLIHTPCV